MAVKDAKSLYKAGEKKLGTDEKAFIRIFSEQSRAHLAAVASAYRDMYGNSLKKVWQLTETGLTFSMFLFTSQSFSSGCLVTVSDLSKFFRQ